MNVVTIMAVPVLVEDQILLEVRHIETAKFHNPVWKAMSLFQSRNVDL
jgi:hypothetical protein